MGAGELTGDLGCSPCISDDWFEFIFRLTFPFACSNFWPGIPRPLVNILSAEFCLSRSSIAFLNKILIWLASAPILLFYDLCMLFLRWLNIATKSKLAWLKRIFLFPNALFRIQYSSAENTIPGGLHFALLRIDISTTKVAYNNILYVTYTNKQGYHYRADSGNRSKAEKNKWLLIPHDCFFVFNIWWNLLEWHKFSMIAPRASKLLCLWLQFWK